MQDQERLPGVADEDLIEARRHGRQGVAAERLLQDAGQEVAVEPRLRAGLQLLAPGGAGQHRRRLALERDGVEPGLLVEAVLFQQAAQRRGHLRQQLRARPGLGGRQPRSHVRRQLAGHPTQGGRAGLIDAPEGIEDAGGEVRGGERQVAFGPDLADPVIGPHAEVVVDPAVRQGLDRELPLLRAHVGRLDLHRGEEAGEGSGCRHGHRDRRELGRDGLHPIRLPGGPDLEDDPFAREGAKTALADVRRQDVHLGRGGQVVKAAAVIEVVVEVRLHQAVDGQGAVEAPAPEPGEQAQGDLEGDAADDAVADVEGGES